MTSTEQRIAELQKQLDELKASLEKKDDGLWVPNWGDNYWCIDSEAECLLMEFDDDPIDFDRIKYNNVFQTEEQAERHAKRLKLYNKLWRLAEHLNGDWVPERTNSRILKYAIKSEFDEFKVNSFSYYSNFGAPIFRSQELAGKAISMLTDEEKEIFKNIYRP